MTLTFKNTGQRWTVRQGAGTFTQFDLVWPNDFPGYPDNIDENQTVGIESIKLVVTTANVIASPARRPRLRLLDDQFFTLNEWHAATTIPNNTAGSVHMWSMGGFTDALTGGTARTMLPSGLWLVRFSSIRLDLISLQTGDNIDEVCVTGRFG